MPPDDVLQWVYFKALDRRDPALPRADLDAGLEPNGLAGSVDPVLFVTGFRGWNEGVAALLDAGARIDQTDSSGDTVLMRANRGGSIRAGRAAARPRRGGGSGRAEWNDHGDVGREDSA
jgi:hypothetical protein